MALETFEGQRAALQDVMRQRPDYDSAICQALKAKEKLPTALPAVPVLLVRSAYLSEHPTTHVLR
jgi:hypothetical protein